MAAYCSLRSSSGTAIAPRSLPQKPRARGPGHDRQHAVQRRQREIAAGERGEARRQRRGIEAAVSVVQRGLQVVRQQERRDPGDVDRRHADRRDDEERHGQAEILRAEAASEDVEEKIRGGDGDRARLAHSSTRRTYLPHTISHALSAASAWTSADGSRWNCRPAFSACGDSQQYECREQIADDRGKFLRDVCGDAGRPRQERYALDASPPGSVSTSASESTFFIIINR